MYLATNEAAMLLFMFGAGKNSRDLGEAPLTGMPRRLRIVDIDIKLIREKWHNSLLFQQLVRTELALSRT